VNLGLHYDDGAPVWQGENHLDARRGMSRDGADGVGACVENVACGVQFTNPRGLEESSGFGIA